MGVVYCFTNIKNGKVYVGLTRNKLNSRVSGHICDSKKSPKYPFHKALNKYGMEGFMLEILFESDNLNALNKMEKYFINVMGAIDFGYNLQTGGYDRYTLADSVRKKLSTYRKGKPGRLHTEDEKRRISESNKGKKKDKCPEWKKEKLSKMFSGEGNNMYGKRGKDSPCYGRTGEKHPLFGKRGADCHVSKKVICIDTGVIYDSATECAKILGLNNSKICMVCRGIRNKTGGLSFKYMEDKV